MLALQELTASNVTLTKMYGNWLLELAESLRVASDNYDTMSGVMFRNSRIGSPVNDLATAQVNMATSS